MDTKLLLELIDTEINGLFGLAEEKNSPIKTEKGETLELSIPKFVPTESWGKPGSESRKQVEQFVRAIPGSGIKSKIHELQKVMVPSKTKNFGTRRIISSLVLLESLAALLNEFSASSSGFILEGFIAALLGGEQKSDTEGGSLPIEDIYIYGTEMGGGKPVSLKLLSKGGDVKGSFKNLVDGIYGKFGEMPYLVVYKDGTLLRFYQFVFNMYNLPMIFLEDKRNLSLLGKMEKEVLQKIESLSNDEDFGELYALLQKTPGYLSGKQWYLSAGKITDADKGGLLGSEYLTEIKIDPEELKALSASYIDQIGQYVTEMFNSLKSLSSNINLYITKKNRDAAIGSAEEASSDARQINRVTLKQIQKDKAEG